MAQKPERLNISVPSPRRTARPGLWASATTFGGLVGTYLEKNYMPPAWRSDGGLWDVASHAGNVVGTMAVVGSMTLTIAGVRGHLFDAVPLKKACATAVLAGACGIGANVISETPAILDTPYMTEHYTALTPDVYDALYGDITAVAAAGLMAYAMRERREQASPLSPTELPGNFL